MQKSAFVLIQSSKNKDQRRHVKEDFAHILVHQGPEQFSGCQCRPTAPGLQVGAELLRDLGLQWPGKKG